MRSIFAHSPILDFVRLVKPLPSSTRKVRSQQRKTNWMKRSNDEELGNTLGMQIALHYWLLISRGAREGGQRKN